MSELLRVQKRYVWDGDQRGHFIYVLQRRKFDGHWEDIPVVDENEKPADYD
jgi:hypothetical protein